MTALPIPIRVAVQGREVAARDARAGVLRPDGALDDRQRPSISVRL